MEGVALDKKLSHGGASEEWWLIFFTCIDETSRP
jgi:hypothetical protein